MIYVTPYTYIYEAGGVLVWSKGVLGTRRAYWEPGGYTEICSIQFNSSPSPEPSSIN